jgi:hypothetical protein
VGGHSFNHCNFVWDILSEELVLTAAETIFLVVVFFRANLHTSKTIRKEERQRLNTDHNLLIQNLPDWPDCIVTAHGLSPLLPDNRHQDQPEHSALSPEHLDML